jgi:hypothetical protein
MGYQEGPPQFQSRTPLERLSARREVSGVGVVAVMVMHVKPDSHRERKVSEDNDVEERPEELPRLHHADSGADTVGAPKGLKKGATVTATKMSSFIFGYDKGNTGSEADVQSLIDTQPIQLPWVTHMKHVSHSHRDLLRHTHAHVEHDHADRHQGQTSHELWESETSRMSSAEHSANASKGKHKAKAHGHAEHHEPSSAECAIAGVVLGLIYFFFTIVFAVMGFSDMPNPQPNPNHYTVVNAVSIHLISICVGTALPAASAPTQAFPARPPHARRRRRTARADGRTRPCTDVTPPLCAQAASSSLASLAAAQSSPAPTCSPSSLCRKPPWPSAVRPRPSAVSACATPAARAALAPPPCARAPSPLPLLRLLCAPGEERRRAPELSHAAASRVMRTPRAPTTLAPVPVAVRQPDHRQPGPAAHPRLHGYWQHPHWIHVHLSRCVLPPRSAPARLSHPLLNTPRCCHSCRSPLSALRSLLSALLR